MGAARHRRAYTESTVSWVAPQQTGKTGSKNQLGCGCKFQEWEGAEQVGKAQRRAAAVRLDLGQAQARRESLEKKWAGKALSAFSVLRSLPGKGRLKFGRPSCGTGVWALLLG